jgi:hypothetical protein
MSHLETIARAAYQNWAAQFGSPTEPVDWKNLSPQARNGWISVVLAVLNTARTTGVL